MEGKKKGMGNNMMAKNGIDPDYLHRLSEDWKEYEKSFNEQVRTVMGQQQNIYDGLSMKWAENSRNLRTQVAESFKSGSDGSQELYNFMKNYQNKLNARILKAMDIENDEYKQMLEKWNDDATRMDSLLSTLDKEGTEEDKPTYMDLYSSWVNLSNDMARQFTKAMREGNGEYEKLAMTWKEFREGMREIFLKLPATTPGYEQLVKAWEETTVKIGAEIARLVNEGNTNLERIRTSWEKASEQMRSEMYTIFKDFNYEELYLGFFNRSVQMMGENWPMTMGKSQYNQMENDLVDLRKKIEELEKDISSKND